MIKYRPHRGSLDKAMKEVREFDSLAALAQHVNKTWHPEELVNIRFEYACYDDRIKWDTWYVVAEFKNKVGVVVVGMSNGTFEKTVKKII